MPANSNSIVIQSPNVRYYEDVIEADYEYDNVRCKKDEKTGNIKVRNKNYVIFNM